MMSDWLQLQPTMLCSTSLQKADIFFVLQNSLIEIRVSSTRNEDKINKWSKWLLRCPLIIEYAQTQEIFPKGNQRDIYVWHVVWGLFSVIPPCKLRNFKFSRDGGLTPEIRVVITNESTRGVYTSLTFTVSISIRPWIEHANFPSNRAYFFCSECDKRSQKFMINTI